MTASDYVFDILVMKSFYLEQGKDFGVQMLKKHEYGKYPLNQITCNVTTKSYARQAMKAR